jgi:predicted 3-demethylubiquinone-9 3-methyltransferase (glyoxalase superfamily)
VACGWLTAKYGLSWQVVPRRAPRDDERPGPEKEQRVAAAMLAMTKFDIAALEQAWAG